MSELSTILYFSGGDDSGKFISVWDIGVPKGDDYQTTCKYVLNMYFVHAV